MDTRERKEKIEKYGSAYQELAGFIQTLSFEELNYKPAPEKWSGHEIIVHIADSEANSYVRVRKALAEPGQLVMGYDQDVWTKVLDYAHQDMKLHLELFRLLRQASYDLIRNLPEEKWQNQYDHTEYGLVGLETWLDTYAKHVAGHIEQIKRNIAAMHS
jgi:hypothetical protein